MNLSILDISCKWSHTIFVLLSLAYFTKHNVYKVHPCCSMYQKTSFLFMAGKYHYLFIRFLVIDALAVSTLWLLWIVLLWTCVYMYLFEYQFSILLAVYLGVELWGYMVILCLTFWGTAKLFSTAAAPFYIPISNM